MEGCLFWLLLTIPIWVFDAYGASACILSIVLEVVLVWVACKYFSGSEKKDSAPLGKTVLSVSLLSRTEYIKEIGEIPVFAFLFSGKISSRNKRIKITLKLWELKGKTKYPIYSSINLFQSEGCNTVTIEKELDIPYADSSISMPVELLPFIPIDSLSFSNRGNLKLLCEVSVKYIPTYPAYSINSQAVYNTSTSMNYNNVLTGYIDEKKERISAQVAAVRLATFLATADGHADMSEANIIKKYISRSVDIAFKSEAEQTKNKLNEAAKDAFSVPLKERDLVIESICYECKNFTTPNKTEIIQLLLSVTSADEITKKSEIDFLNNVVSLINYDFETFKQMRDKVLSVDSYEKQFGVSMVNVSDLLGISDDMSVEEKKSILNKAYRKWNQLQNSKDEDIRKQALEMIKLISEERAKLKK